MTTPHSLAQALSAWERAFRRRTVADFMRNARESGVSPQQYGALMYLFHNDRRGVSGIGEDMGVTPAAASQMIERLVQQGLLERSEDPHDRRAKKIALTVKPTAITNHPSALRPMRRAISTSPFQ